MASFISARSIAPILLLAVSLCWLSSCNSSEPATVQPRDLAPEGHAKVYYDDKVFPFNDDFNYVEYLTGEELEDEYGYFVKLGYHSYFEVDLNAADSNYVQFIILDGDIKTGAVFSLADSGYRGMGQINYDLSTEVTNTLKQHVTSGHLTLTKVDVPGKRVSGTYVAEIETNADHSHHTLEGSFTDVFYLSGEDKSEHGSAEVSLNGWNSAFKSGQWFDAFGNIHGQGRTDGNYFAVVIHTDEDPQQDYESLVLFLPNPLHNGVYDLEKGCAVYNRSVYDTVTHLFTVAAADTNQTTLKGAVTITDYDTLQRRFSGTFDFTITDGSPRSPVAVHNGSFVNLFW